MTADKRKGPKKPPASPLSDAVMAALSSNDSSEDSPQTGNTQPGFASAPSDIAAPTHATDEGKPNGFRNGPGSFADLVRRWSGAPEASTAAGPPEAGPPEAGPPEAGPPEAGPPEAGPPEAGPKGTSTGAAAATDEPASTRRGPHEEPPLVSNGDALPSAADTIVEPPSADDTVTDGDGPRETKDTEADLSAPAIPGSPIKVRYLGKTDVGLVREHNEDNYLVADLSSDAPPSDAPRDGVVSGLGCIFAVCDGMGGAAAGEVASQMAVDTISEVMRLEPAPGDRDGFARRLVTAIEEAGHRIFSAAKMDRTRRGMGTTSTLAGLIDDTLFVGQVGDSRAYVLRGEQFSQITKDQSLVNQLIEAGQLTEEEAEAFEHSNIILQALGTTEEVTVDLTFLQLRRGDRLLMCSDGLSGLVHGEMIKEVLQTTSDLSEAASKLIQMANAGGGHDNITVILADFDGEGLSGDTSASVAYQQYPLPPGEDRQSLPPRETSIKPGGTKPGADVKVEGETTGPAEDVELPTERSSSMTTFALVGLVLAALVIGAYFAFSGGEEQIEPPPPAPPPTSDTEELFDDVPEEVVEAQTTTGRVELTSDVEEGTLYVNGEAQGLLADGMALDLLPGGYQLEVRSGDTMVTRQTITVTAGETLEVDLSLPVGDLHPGSADPGSADPGPAAPEPSAAAQGSQEAAEPPAPAGDEDQATIRRRRPPRTGPNGPLPSNPF